ncbi:MAG: hypothetical protein ACYTG0_15375 [Planctomycetota bacterium]|jgi:hypothetical protein
MADEEHDTEQSKSRVDREHDERIAEFTALRNEIVTRIRLRHQMEAFALAVLGILLTFAKDDSPIPTALYSYPILALFLALAWKHNHRRIGELGWYIRTRRETSEDGFWWENAALEMTKSTRRRWRWFRSPRFAATGVFAGAQLVAIVVATARSAQSVSEKLSAIVANGFVVFLTILVLWWTPRQTCAGRTRRRKNTTA